ncbi:hypothetical protein ACJX0J_016377, partial [Zea mays]
MKLGSTMAHWCLIRPQSEVHFLTIFPGSVFLLNSRGGRYWRLSFAIASVVELVCNNYTIHFKYWIAWLLWAMHGSQLKSSFITFHFLPS